MALVRVFSIVLGLCIGFCGCAHAPKVVPIASASTSSAQTYYALPKASFVATVTADRHVFSPGPLTAELEQWLKGRETDPCSATALSSPRNVCFWRFELKRPSAARAAAACEISSAYGNGQSSLSFPQPLKIVAKSAPDGKQQFAVAIGPQAFEKTTLKLTFSPTGGLSAFAATSTNLIADTAEKLALSLVTKGRMFASETDLSSGEKSETLDIENLRKLALKLADARERRIAAAGKPDSAGALAAIDAEMEQLRALAEGTDQVKPFDIEIAFEPKDKLVDLPGRTSEVSTSTSLDARFKCGADGKSPIGLTAKFELIADTDSLMLARAAKKMSSDSDGLRYRVPVAADAKLIISCTGDEKKNGQCAALAPYSTAFDTRLVVPQWGPTLTLPRRMGWRAGAIDATLDPATGALLTLSTTNEGSFEAAMVNQAYQSMLARQDAAKKDTERAALERERAVLEEQVKICTARAALRLPPGDECPQQTP